MTNPTCGAWYVVRTRPGDEERALQAIEGEGYEARVLWCHRLQKHNRSKRLFWKPRRLAPGYVFVRLPSVEHTSVVRNCEGVVCFVGVRHQTPVALRVDEMGTMVGIEATEEFEQDIPPAPPRPTFQVGDEVFVLDGIVAGQKGQVVRIYGKGEVGLLLPFLNADRPIRIAVDLLENAN